MKRILTLAAFISLIFAFSGEASAKNLKNFGGGVYFYSELSPYGTWIELGTGVTVWRPAGIGQGWAPYTQGYWDWTNDGWYWQSNEPFGYITFHYGRWYYDDYYGWIWIPDNEWAPAWVEWRYDSDYIGWAPLPPYANFSINFGIHFTTNYFTPYHHWHFISYRYMCDPYSYRYYVPSNNIYAIYTRTKYRTNYGYSDGRVINRGVNIDYVRRRAGRDISERTIERVRDTEQIRNNGGRDGNRIRTYAPGSDNIARQNVDERHLERTTRRTNLEFDKLAVDRNRDISPRDRSDLRNDNQVRERERIYNSQNDNNIGERNRTDNNPFINRDRNIEKRSERNNNPNIDRNRNSSPRPNVDRNRSNERPRTSNPSYGNDRTRERPQVSPRTNNNRGSEKKENDNGRKRRR